MANVITYTLVLLTLGTPTFIYLARDKTKSWFNTQESKNKLYTIIAIVLLISEIQWFTTTIVTGALIDSERYFALFRGELCTFLSPVLIYAFFSKNEKVIKAFTLWGIPGGLLPVLMPGVYSYTGNAWEVYMDARGMLDHVIFVIIPMFLLFTIKWNIKRDMGPLVQASAIYILYVFVVMGIPYFITGDASYGIYTTALLQSSHNAGENFGFFADYGIKYPASVFVLLAIGFTFFTIYIRVSGSIWYKYYGDSKPEWYKK